MTAPVPIGNTTAAIDPVADRGLEAAHYARSMAAEPFVAALQPLLDATGAVIVEADEAVDDDIPIAFNGAVVYVRVPNLDGALDRLVAQVERELGASLADLGREDKQRAVARLHELGAFNLRRSVEAVAEALGVSRFTVYNYLDRTG